MAVVRLQEVEKLPNLRVEVVMKWVGKLFEL